MGVFCLPNAVQKYGIRGTRIQIKSHCLKKTAPPVHGGAVGFLSVVLQNRYNPQIILPKMLLRELNYRKLLLPDDTYRQEDFLSG